MIIFLLIAIGTYLKGIVRISQRVYDALRAFLDELKRVVSDLIDTNNELYELIKEIENALAGKPVENEKPSSNERPRVPDICAPKPELPASGINSGVIKASLSAFLIKVSQFLFYIICCSVFFNLLFISLYYMNIFFMITD
jgi:hypothetical protein